LRHVRHLILEVEKIGPVSSTETTIENRGTWLEGL
jgi:hypothetical protein